MTSRTGKTRFIEVFIACLVLATACSSIPEPPEGWHTFEESALSVAVRDDWMVPELNDHSTAPFDVIRQDTDHFESSETLARFVAITDYGSVLPGVTDTHGARDAINYLVVIDPFGQAHPVLPDPVDLSRGGMKIIRQDVPRGSKDNVYYLWAAEDRKGQVVMTALGGEGITQEMIDAVGATLSVRTDS